MSEVAPEDRGIAAAPVAAVDPCPPCPLPHKGPSLASRAGRQVLRLLHDKRVDTELRVLAPVLIVRAVAYAGGGVEAAKLIEQALKALGV